MNALRNEDQSSEMGDDKIKGKESRIVFKRLRKILVRSAGPLINT